MYQEIMVPLAGSGLAECVLPHVEAIDRILRSACLPVLMVRAPVCAMPMVQWSCFPGHKKRKGG